MIRISESSGAWSAFCDRIVRFLQADTINLVVDGQIVTGFRSPDSPALWIRDHSDILRGGVFMWEDVKSAVEAFASTQAANGRVYDFVNVTPLGLPGDRENWERWVRVPVEADVEYRFVNAAWLAWQATSDNDWIEHLLPNLEMALRYSMSHPWRWDRELGLVKRAFTIDTWDFDYTAGRTPWLNFQITDDTFWGIAHGDNSGLYRAARVLAQLYEQFDYEEKSRHWSSVADGLRKRANDLLFNGRFYRHFHKLVPVTIPGVNEEEQLSLSNPMAITRGLATPQIARAILDEYYRRRQEDDSFAEWYSISPPFPNGMFGDEKLVEGAYVNGGVMPLVGGELARAAFENGREAYGLEILEQYRNMIEESGETYLWYFPDGRPSTLETSTSPDAMPTDGWGSSAMLDAFLGGLCGIQDSGSGFKSVRCAPRWIVTGEKRATVRVSYAASRARFGYSWSHDDDRRKIEIEVDGDASHVDLHLMLPPHALATRVIWGGEERGFSNHMVDRSRYVDVRGPVSDHVRIVIDYVDG
ncbi:MAG: hypothetical protein WBW88_10455 [Rhodothermales bacterium]